MTNPSAWKSEPAGWAYTLSSGDAHCRVWRTGESWSAIVSIRGDATAAYSFTTAEAAKAWCEQLIAKRTAGDTA